MKIGLTEKQQEAIESINKSMLVVAGAGSGKTLVLVRRFVEILQKQPELSVRNLLAVTYTRKAAKEMRTRIKARLKELYEQAKAEEIEQSKGAGEACVSEDAMDSEAYTPEWRHWSCVEPSETRARQRFEISRWHQCLADMDSAQIDTIHSLCQSILRSFTIEIGLDPQIEVLDEIERVALKQEAIDETFRRIIASDNANKALLEHFPLETIDGFLQSALNNHLRFDQIALRVEKLSADELAEAIENLLTRTQKQLLTDLIMDEEWLNFGQQISSNRFAEEGNKLEEIRQIATRYFGNIQEGVTSFINKQDAQLQQPKIKESWKLLLDMAEMGAIRVGGNTPLAKELRFNIKTLIEKCKDYSQSNNKGYGLPLSLTLANEDNFRYWQLWQNLIAIARLAHNIYAAKKLEIGKLDFDDLIAKTKEVLTVANSPVRDYYNRTLAHILVDEFQDTNPIQTEIITLLAGSHTKLFFIGDDKQSIYKFQGADVSTFNAWQSKQIDSLIFEHSFRSQPNIVNFVNNIFFKLLPAQKAHVNYRAKYSLLKAQRNSIEESQISNIPKVQVVYLPEADQETNEIIAASDAAAPSKALLEGYAVASWILEKVRNKTQILSQEGDSRDIAYGDFAILTARNSDLQLFESCLSKLNIPYVTSGGSTFLERQEIYDLENMLLFLCNPSNSHALLAILRSPMFGISDEIIHNLASHKKQSLWETLKNFAPSEFLKQDAGFQLISEATILLKRILADMSVLSLSELVYRIIRDTNYDLVALTLPDGKQRYKNIWKFYMLAKDELNAAELVERLNLSRQLSINENNATIDNRQSVKLMTIHAAKGLEFPAVALPCLSSSFSYGKPKMLFHDQYGIVLNTARTEQERDEGIPIAYQLGKTLDDDMDAAEKRRLLYVAMTRARDYLALFIDSNSASNTSVASWLLPAFAKADTSTFEISTPEINDLLDSKKAVVEEFKELDLDLDNIQMNKIEQLLEPMSININLKSNDLPEVSPWQRITPNSSHADPSPILVGKFFHRLMEYLPQNKVTLDDDELIALLEQFADEAVHPAYRQSLIEEGKQLLTIYANSKLQKLFSQAKTICHEWSYYMTIDDNQLLLNRPDLLLESSEGQWFLIDYKTDRFSEKDLEQHALRHRPQLERYSKDFTRLTKIEARLAIYFAQTGMLYEF